MMNDDWVNWFGVICLIILVIVVTWIALKKEGEVTVNKIDKILKIAKGVDSHVSIYIFEKTKKEIEEIKVQLPKEFYVEMDMLEEEDKYIAFRADKLVGFEYVEITAYLKEATEEEDLPDQY